MAWICVAGAATDSIPAKGGPILITPVLHSSLQIEHGGKVIQVDPWTLGDPSLTRPADLILLSACCDLHHIDPKAIAEASEAWRADHHPGCCRSKRAGS